ncbi:Dnah1, partial [Symbiodinium natans]
MACILLGTHESVTYIDFVSDVCAAAELLLLEVSQANETLPDGAIGRASQLATQLQRCKVERDELRRQLHEKSEIHVELTRKLRKAQEANKTLDGELNKAEALRLAAQNRAVAAREARGQVEALLDSLRDQLRDVEEADSAEVAVSFLKIKALLEGFALEPQLPAPNSQGLKDPEPEEELPTAGGLLREWASVYENTEARERPSDLQAGRDAAGPVLLQHRSPGWNKANKQREAPTSPPSARGAGEQLAQLSLRDLSEIKALKKPPPPIRMLMEVCCLLFHIQPVKHLDEQCVHHRLRTDYWEPARRYLLSDPFLLSKLRSHGKDVGASQRAKIKKYFKDPEFSAERMLKCSR